MHLLQVTASVAALLALCSGSPVASNYVLHERAESMRTTPTLVKRNRINAGRVMPMRFGLAQRDINQGYDWLLDVSHPESKNYGKHWSAADVNKAFAPTSESVQTVRDWLISAGIEDSRITVSDNKGWLAFDATVEEAEQLVKAQYYEHSYDHDVTKYTVGCDSYYLPDHIRQHVDYVTPGVKHHVYKRSRTTLSKRGATGAMGKPTFIKAPVEPIPAPGVDINAKTIPVNCSNYVIDGDCIRSLYGYPSLNLNKAINPANALGIYESDRQFYSQADLEMWFSSYLPVAQGTVPGQISIDGGIAATTQNNSDGEPMLDLTLAYALIYPQTVDIYQVDDYYEEYDNGFGDTMLDAFDGSFCTYSAFGQKGDNNTIDPVYPDPQAGGYEGPLECGTLTPPKVLSISYGGPEIDFPVAYVERQCNEFMKLALQGTTTVVSSGDYGVAGYPGASNNSNACFGDGSLFAPEWFATCPYVLSVGATEIRPNVSGLTANPEQAVFAQFTGEALPYTSGGGFSNVFDRPSYQSGALSTYFSTADLAIPSYSTTKGKNIGKNGGKFNRGGRGFPDVAANGAWWHIYLRGGFYRYGGTSMSAPIFASGLNLINEARMKAGKSSVGFVHPTLYAHPEAFHDIDQGYNQGCGYDQAFEAIPGWDPVTGLGTPKYAKLLDIFMSLP